MDRKKHWEHIYSSKMLTEVSWYQPVPTTSLDLIKALGLSKDASIIDVGGGDSFLAEFLLADGFTNITVLDISELALVRAKERLGEKAEKIKWIVSDASQFRPEEPYDLWHDRAAFHFFTEEEQIQKYIRILKNSLTDRGCVVFATFSENGPSKCSGVEINKYSIEDLKTLFSPDLIPVKCRNTAHPTPSGSIQEFSFCSFRKR